MAEERIMNREAVKSSNIASIGYAEGILEVEFSSGSIYQYEGVTAEEHRALMEAPSVGKHFSARIRDAYPGKKIERKSGWQPIATAPKDGTKILSLTPQGKTRIVSWNGHNWESDPHGDFDREEITHWMPLPEKPPF